MKLFLVGGCVRDELLGLNPKDIDFVVLASNFEAMKEYILSIGCEIFVEKPEFGTIRGKHPEFGPADFALPRSDGDYSDGRRPDFVEIVSSLKEDSDRRDFTVNAMYKDIETGEVIDFHGGEADLKNMMLRCVGNPEERFKEDELRRLRALRFIVTKNLEPSHSLFQVIDKKPRLDKVSVERVREELFKMFNFDTRKSWEILNMFTVLRNQVFDHELVMVPTVKKQ